ncbi:MAG TPA: ABC transporter permease [Candidatus Polarisedimenticolia bacterium]|nr:ABC transporter permease [Candidatus Polarisedimenticolia bacterium]
MNQGTGGCAIVRAVTPDTAPPARPPRRSRSRVSLTLGASLVTVFVLCALLAPLLTLLIGYGPFEQVAPRAETPPTPPDRLHLLGTDTLGRDQLSRLVHGAGISLEVGVVAEVIALLLGTAIGGLAGYAGGRIDALLMRAADLVFAFPEPLLALAIIAAIPDPDNAPILRHMPHPSIGVVFLVLGGIGWARIARLVRGEMLKIREQEFARAAEAIGARGTRVVLRHLLPNVLGPLIVVGTFGVGANILMEAWLSFLGVGARPPLPSWGTMVTEGQAYLLAKPWVCVAPGLAILMVVLGFNLLGDGVRDLLDPRRPATSA